MADLVENVLREAAEKESKYKTTEVNKDIDLVIDVGNLMTSDTNPFNAKSSRSNREKYLKDLARDNTQLLLNSIWKLPTQNVDNIVVAQLPDPSTPIPREKPVPKEKALTKWEKYAKLKGIQNKKKSRLVWDEPSQSYKPRWGYNRSGDDTKEWLVEVPGSADPNEDQFAKRKDAKKERIAKNELQRLRNIARTNKSKVPGVGLTPTDAPSKEYLGKALSVAKTSTASIGKFTENLPKEKHAKFQGKKRKFQSNIGNMKDEMSHQLNILNTLGQDVPIVDKNRAANLHIKEMEESRAKQKREDPDGARKKKLTGKRSKHGRLATMKRNLKKGRGGGRGGKSGGRR
ncbi:Rhodanese-related sulfurtransferase [Mactra antiquata]